MAGIISRSVESGVAVLIWNDPDRPVNVKRSEAIAEMLDQVEAVLADDTVVAYVIASGKPGFVAGGDLDELRRCATPGEIDALLAPVRTLLRRIETGGKPAVAAIDGPALGGGLELALACHGRVASSSPSTRLGLPEITLGLMPGAGGTQRLPRLIGLARAMPMILEGRPLGASEALACGLVDKVVDPAEVLDTARSLAASGLAAIQPWARRDWSKAASDPQSVAGRRLISAAWPRVKARAAECDIAGEAILMALHHGLERDIEAGFAIEARHFARVASSRPAHNTIRTAFFGMNAARSAGPDAGAAASVEIRHVAVVGAGLMGSGIAYAAAAAGLRVTLLDRDAESAARGLAAVRKSAERQRAAGRIDAETEAGLVGRVAAAGADAALSSADLVIEAVFEDEAVKAAVLDRVSRAVRPRAVIASNTSTIPINTLARHCLEPARFLGLHFFAPVERMELVEVIRADATSPDALAAGLALVRLLRKLPIVVRDGPGFYTSRVIASYTGEALTLLAEGVGPALVDGVALRFGMPVGPLAMADLTGIPVLLRIFGSLPRDGAAMSGSRALEVLETLLRADRPGKDSGGIYDRDGARLSPWVGLHHHFPGSPQSVPEADIRRRLVYIQVLEAIRALEEGIIDDPLRGDVASVLGWRFPLGHGGVFGFADTVGIDRLTAECEVLAARYGRRFEPPKTLTAMARAGRTFHAA